jgi:hypothetical protein
MALSVALALAGLSMTQGPQRPPPFATVQQPFSGPIEPPWFGHGVSIVGADLEGDGREEALLTGMEGRLAVLRFGADGWTVEPSYLLVLGDPIKVDPVDLDGDGAPDLVVAAKGGLQVLWNDGHGGFALPQVLAKGICLVARGGDLNGDGRCDILASVIPVDVSESEPWMPTGLLAFLGRGSRNFQLAQYTSISGSSDGIAFGDFDEDGMLDAAMGETMSVGLLLNEGNGRLRWGAAAQGGADAGLIACDLDGDGHLDVARNCIESGIQPALFGDGLGQLSVGPPLWPLLAISAGPAPGGYCLDAGDFDADGRPDLLVVQQARPELIHAVARKGFARSEPLPLPWDTWAAGLADVDGDGSLDVVAHLPVFVPAPGQPPQGWLSVLHGDGRGGLRDVRTAPHDDALTGLPFETSVGDLDADGLPDLVESVGWNQGFRVLLSDEQGGWSRPVDHPELPVLLYPRIGDVDGDGRGDLVATGSGGQIVAYLGDGAGGLAGPVTTQLPPGKYSHDYLLADLDADGRSDLVMQEASPTIGGLRVHLASGGGSFGPAVYVAGLGQVQSVHPADLDLDGHLDLVVVQNLWPTRLARVLVLPGLGGGQFGAEQVLDSFDHWIPPVAIADLDGDGLPDIALGSSRFGAENEIVAHLATALGVFGRTVRSSVGIRPWQLATADLDGDGIPDLLAGQPVPEDLLLRGRGDGRFEPWTRLGSLGELSAIADMDRDGDEDLVYDSTVVLNRLR